MIMSIKIAALPVSLCTVSYVLADVSSGQYCSITENNTSRHSLTLFSQVEIYHFGDAVAYQHQLDH